MTQREFKKILETIEKGLYKKWEANYILNDKIESIKKFLQYGDIGNIICAFHWDKSKEEHEFWSKVHDKYNEILNDKKII
jgi:hypothetical protein